MKKLFLALAALAFCTAALAQQLVDPCALNPKTSVAISQSASTQLFSGAAARKNYICAFSVVVPDSEKLALIEGTGSVCATTPLALIGPTLAVSGLSLAANGQLTLGNGSATVAAGVNQNFNVCLLQSGSGLIGGVIDFVQTQ